MSLKTPFAALTVALIACGGSTAPAPQNANTATTANSAAATKSSDDLGPPPQGTDARLAWAMGGSHRSAQNRARDVYRHPKETLAFFGVTDRSHVVELWPGNGWYTEILGPLVRDTGKLTVTNFDPAAVTGEQKDFAETYDKKLAASPNLYGKIEVRRIHPPNDIVLGPDGSADVVLTFRNLHGWIHTGFAKNVFDAAFKVLKSGGVFGVIDHRAAAGVDAKVSSANGYVPEQAVLDLAKAAGFKLAGKSEINANPKDDHNHENGVWALPPVLRNGEKDRAKYLAIGESDRFTIKFVKP